MLQTNGTAMRFFTNDTGVRREVCRENRMAMSVLDDKNKWIKSKKCGSECGMPERTLNLLYNHVDLWKVVAGSSSPALILEDDASFEPSFDTYHDKAFGHLSNNTEWDIIWPGYCCCAPDGPRITAYLYKHKLTGCAQSYILHPRGAQKLLKSLPMKRCHGADHFMNSVISTIREWKGFAFSKSTINQNKNFKATHRFQSERMVTW
jgi:hypothetical protein